MCRNTALVTCELQVERTRSNFVRKQKKRKDVRQAYVKNCQETRGLWRMSTLHCFDVNCELPRNKVELHGNEAELPGNEAELPEWE